MVLLNNKPYRHISLRLKLVSLLCIVLLVSACRAEKLEFKRTLETTHPSVGTIEKVISASGKIVPRVEVMVGSEVSGRIDDVLVDFNTLVEKGDVLAVIDPTTFESRIAQIQNQIESAMADVDVQIASIVRAKVSLKNAELQLTRKQDLFAKDAASRVQLEIAERDAGLARADIDLANARLVSSRAAVRQLRAQITERKTDLSRTIIRSPIKGIVIDRKVDPGQTVQASFNSPELFAIAADLSEINIEVAIAESDVAGLDKGDKARFTVDAYPGQSVSGMVQQLRYKPQENKNIVTYTAIVRAANPDGRLLPGMTVNMQIVTDIKRKIKRLPVAVEKFRPSPDDVALFAGDNSALGGKVSLLEPTLIRLRDIGISDNRIHDFKTHAEIETQFFQDLLNDPKKTYMHITVKIRFNEMVNELVKKTLSSDEQASYTAQMLLDRKVRRVDIWVADAVGKMRRKTVTLGLSDGSFVEVISGLNDDDQVIIGIIENGSQNSIIP